MNQGRLTKKIAELEEMIRVPEKLNAAVRALISSSDLNNDEQLSKVEFRVSN